jgi:amidohydrolase
MNKLMLFFSVLLSSSISADLKNDLEKQISPLMDKVIEWRHDIHQNPELSNREFRTAKKVEEHLLSLGIKVETQDCIYRCCWSYRGRFTWTNNCS